MEQTQLDRIEANQTEIKAMMAALLDALADEAEDEDPGFDLDGNPLAAERDSSQPL